MPVEKKEEKNCNKENHAYFLILIFLFLSIQWSEKASLSLFMEKKER